jgi:hypothetical protein
VWQVFNLQKTPLGGANMVAKKEERKRGKREKGKMTRCQLKATRHCDSIFCI